jgi:hypothetical protein
MSHSIPVGAELLNPGKWDTGALSIFLWFLCNKKYSGKATAAFEYIEQIMAPCSRQSGGENAHIPLKSKYLGLRTSTSLF